MQGIQLGTQAIPGNSRRERVLLLAYACSPYRGSEPGLGWQWAVEIAKNFDTWVLCKEGYQGEITKYFTENGNIPGLHFCFVPETRTEKLLKKTPGGYYLAYNRWHRRAGLNAFRLNQSLHFDLIHQLNFVTFREPGYLWRLGVPFIWGPLGGTENYPWRFLGAAGILGVLQEGGRSLLNGLHCTSVHVYAR